MLGDMPSVRAAAEKPPLSTTFTKVAMLVMRSMRSPDHAVKLPEMFRRFMPYQASRDHVCSHFRQAQMWPLRRAPLLGRIESELANPDLRDVLRRPALSPRQHHHLRHSACVPRTSTSKGRADAAACSPHAASKRYQPRLHEASWRRPNPRTR